MQDSEEKGHETEAVGNTGGADCLRAEPKNCRQNKQADCQHVHLIPAVTPIFLLFLQKFLPKGNPCELFVCFYLWCGTKLNRYQDGWKLASLYTGTLNVQLWTERLSYGSSEYHLWNMNSLFNKEYNYFIRYFYFSAKMEISVLVASHTL